MVDYTLININKTSDKISWKPLIYGPGKHLGVKKRKTKIQDPEKKEKRIKDYFRRDSQQCDYSRTQNEAKVWLKP